MNALWQVFVRELRERRMIIVGSLAVGVMLTLLPLLPQFNTNSAAAAQGMSGLAFPLGAGIAIYGGASFVAAELKERRLSFFMSRPSPMFAIWGGKMAAALALGLICMALVLLPLTMTGRGVLLVLAQPDVGLEDLRFALIVVFGSMFLWVPLAHAAGIALRSRSAWLLLDIAVLVSILLLTWRITTWFLMVSAMQLIGFLILFVGSSLMIVLSIAGYLGVAHGRVDLRAAHARQSIVSAIGIVLVGLGLLAHSSWVRAVDVEDLESFRVVPCAGWNCPPVIVGNARWRADYQSVFVAWDGRMTRLEPTWLLASSLSGNRIAWMEIDQFEPPKATIVIRDESSGASRRTGIQTDPHVTNIALSGNGERLAIAAEDSLQVYELDPERLIHSARLTATPYWLRFVSPDRLLAIRLDRSTDGGPFSSTRIEEIRIGEQRQEPVYVDGAIFDWDPDRRLVLARSGTKIRAISTEDWSVAFEREAADAVITPEGIAFSRPGAAEVGLVDPSNGSEHSIPLPPGAAEVELGPFIDGVLMVSTAPIADSTAGHRGQSGDSGRQATDPTRELIALDLASGGSRALAKGLRPVRLEQPAVKGPWFLQETSEGKRLVRLDPASGQIGIIPSRENS